MIISRRNLVQLLGLAGASYAMSSLPFAPLARAGNPTVPKRIVFFYTEQGTRRVRQSDGTIVTDWTPAVPNAPSPLSIAQPWSSSNFTLGPTHQPLASFQDQLLFLDGLDMISANVDPTPPDNSHIAGTTHALIAANRKTGSVAGGASIDQLIAQTITTTALASLETFVGADSYPYESGGGTGIGENGPLYSAPGAVVPIQGNPMTIYQRMFPNGVDSSPAAQAAAALKIKQQKSVLEHAATSFSSLSSRVGKLDATRLESHAAAIRDLENRLALGANVACAKPDSTVIDPVIGLDQGSASYSAHMDVFQRLLQVALACDLTRVATLYVSQPPDDLFGYQANMSGTGDFHDMVHKTSGTSPPLDGDATALGVVRAYHTYHATQFAKFLSLLQGITESDGTTLLDNTLVVWCGQLAGGDHSLDRLPYLLAGNMGGAVTPGRYVMMPRTANGGPAHNDFFVSLANMMGVPTSTFGNPSVCKGALTGWAT